MKSYLIDENLPSSLGQRLGVDHVHATQIETRASDTLLWEYARDHGLCVITRDTDFFDRLLIHGAPPKVVWVRLGNFRKQDLLLSLEGRWSSIRKHLKQADLVEVYADKIEALCFPK